MKAGLVLLLLALVACDRSSHDDPPCSASSECGADQLCLLNLETGSGRCLDTPGRDAEPAPPRVLGNPSRTDVLFVVDDGPGTAAIQSRLVASLGALVEQARTNDLRVLVTTANARSSICDPPNEASHGSLAARSCLDRLDAFVGSDGTDAQWLCTDVCTYTTEDLGLDPAAPWIDVHRLPEGIDPVGALACLVPQGISGCQHAAPVRATALALETDALRNAGAQVVIATDGVDCSVTDEGAAAFDPDGLRALWSDPDAAAATPAVCWNAGVACQGDPAGFDACDPVDRGLDGAVISGDATPVLEPLASYYGGVDDVFFSSQLHVIAGTSIGAPSEPSYSAVGDPAWLLEHGIDPGCSDGTITALPPVRLRDVASSLTSVCDPDYAGLMREMLTGQSTACLRPCAAEAITVSFEPAPEDGGDGELVAIPACEGEPLDVPAGAPACHAVRHDSPACAEETEGNTTELVLLTPEPLDTGAFSVTPNPWSPYVQIAGCDG